MQDMMLLEFNNVGINFHIHFQDELLEKTGQGVDIISLIFVLSAIHPDKFQAAISNLYRCLRPGGMVLVRDYGLYDMAMLRFGPGSKLGERLYVRQDGTRLVYVDWFRSKSPKIVSCTFTKLNTKY